MKKMQFAEKKMCDRNNTYFKDKPILCQALGPAGDRHACRLLRKRTLVICRVSVSVNIGKLKKSRQQYFILCLSSAPPFPYNLL